MKKLLLLAAIILLVGCSEEFERAYDKIDGEFPRALSMIFVETDFGPGDTVTLRSVWAGKPITASDVVWEVSWKLSGNGYGNELVRERQSLEPYIVEPMTEVTPDSAKTQIFEMKVVISEDVIRESPAIPDNWTENLKRYGITFNPEDFDNIEIPQSKDSILTMLEILAELEDDVKENFPVEQGLYIEALCQLMTIKVRFFCDYSAAGGFQGYFDHSVRYQSQMLPMPGIYINNRPIIQDGMVYVVPGDHQKFYPNDHGATDSIPVVSDSVAFVYDDKNTYFLVQYMDQRDSTKLIYDLESDSTTYEDFSDHWFYDENAYESMGLIGQVDKQFRDAGNPFMVYRMNFDEKPKRETPMTYWLEMSDARFGIQNRPIGRDVKEVTITLN